MHKIDLKNYQIRTDLAIEATENNNIIKKDEENFDNIKIVTIELDEENSKFINKKAGTYITIEFQDITDYENGELVKSIFATKVEWLLKKLNIGEDANCLIIGLGNDKSTPDALGPKVIDNILVTRHLYLLSQAEDGFRCVSAFAPGVMGQTGLETSDLIKCIVKDYKPDFVVAIDALASQAIERVNKTIQITDTGIQPGSGVGNKRKEISFDTVGVPVVAIGVPTVVDAVTIVSDTINYMYKNFAYTKSHYNSPANKLSIGIPNYLNKNVDVNNEDKEELFGLIGKLNEEDVKSLIYEVLSPIGYNLMVTPKEVDFIIEKLGNIIGNGLNRALHKNVTNL